MDDEVLSGNLNSGKLFLGPDEDDISGQPKFEFSPSDKERLAALGNALANSSDLDIANSGLAQLIDGEIANNTSDSNTVASQLEVVPEQSDSNAPARSNTLPEEGIGNTVGSEGSDTIKKGTDNDDLIVGTTANELMYAKRGQDTLDGNGGEDTLYGGKGSDDCGGGDGDDDIKGDKGDDDCKGDDGNDKVYGNEGKDKVRGNKGNDKLYGGKDDDDCKGDEGNDTVRGDKGNDKCDGGDGDDDVGGGKDNDTLTGGAGNDTCDGGEGDDSAGGGVGNDTLVGGDGNDTCSGDEGDDSVGGGTGNDTLVGGDGNDTCDGGEGDDSAGGGAGNDTLVGGGGNDTCSGDDGDDSVGGGTGNDTLVGGGGNDTCQGDEGDDSVVGGGGDDSVGGGSGNDTCVAGDGNDMVDGGDGDDSVVGGGGGNDTLIGGNNNDTIVGGTGNHTCTGGAGNDVFVMENRTSPGGSSVITDYKDGEDKFLLFGGLNFSSLFFAQVGLNVEIRVSGNFLLAVLLNVSAAILDASDFLSGGGSGNIPGNNNNNNNNNNNTTPTPTNTPPQVEANRTLSLGGGTRQTISSDFLRFFDREQGFGGTTFKITELPPTTSGQLFYKGVAVTQVGLTFSQTDITLGLLSFQAAVGFSGAASFGFEVSDGTTVLLGQRFSFNVIKTSFDFAGSTVPQTITGSEFDDTVTGGDADDSITGSTGKDKVKAGKGNDKIKGDDDDDDIEAEDGDDDVEGGKGKDKIKGGKGKDKIKGDDDDDDIDGEDDDDDVEGGKGKDKIKGGKGKDKVKGDDDDDDIDGGDDDDSLEGGIGNDTVVGGSGNDNVTGNDGDDSIEGGEGTNTLTGGAGRDRFIYRVSRQEITTVVQADLITDFSVTDDVLEFASAAFANLSVASLTRLAITSTTTVGSIGGANLLDFSADISVTSIATLQARFTALGGSPGPVFCQFTDASTGGTVLVFSIGARFEIIARFSAVINLQIGNFVFGGPTLNVPTGTSGPDIFNFGTFPSGVTFNGLAGDDSIVGSNFDDSVIGGEGNDFIDGKKGKERISGGAGNDRLFGGEDDDTITGDEGDDTINGGLGFDFLTGGSGADIFSYTTTKEGGDKISDFTSGTDKFQFVSSNFGNITGSNFDLVNVVGTSTDITGKELLLFSGTFASLAAVQAQIGTTVGGGTAPFFGLYQNAAGESVLFFDADGTGPGSAVTVANLGTGVTSLGSADFVFTGTIAPPPPPPPGNSTVDLNGNSTFPAGSNDFSSNPGGYGFSGPVLFTGNAGDNKVTGTAFADFLSGASGADLLNGGSGPDTLNGGPGPDTLTGGLGGDVFIYSGPADGPDTITDFTFGVDKLSFNASVFGNLTTANFDGVSGVSPDITGKELVIFTGGTFASFEDAQTTATGSSSSPGFFAFTNAANETVLVFDSNGTIAGGFTTVANLGTAAGSLGTGDFVFTGSIANTPVNTSTSGGSVTDLTAPGNTFPVAVNNFGSGAGGYNFTTPVLFTGNASNNSVTATQFADILSGGSGADIFDGGLGDDSMSGDEGDDSLFGGGGSDTLTGGTGNDTLIGGAGTNVLNGGAGEDVFVFAGTTADGGDVITNYSTADDLIALDSSAFAGFTTGPLGLNFYTYSTALTVSAIEPTLTGPSIIALYDGANTKLYYDANGSTVGGSSLFATVNGVDLGLTGNAELFLF